MTVWRGLYQSTRTSECNLLSSMHKLAKGGGSFYVARETYNQLGNLAIAALSVA